MFARMMLWLSLFLVSCGAASAQQHRSIIRGTVVGPDGRPIANVAMRAIHEGTGANYRFTSDADGRFTIVQIEPGSYRFVSDDEGFGDFIARALVRLGDQTTVELPLTATSISASADYRPFVLDVEARTSTLRTRLPGDFLADLPFDGRSLLHALLLAPRLAGHPVGPRTPGVLTSNYWLDGFENSSAIQSAPIITPQIETIDAFQVSVAAFDAAFGGGGSTINVLTRSGTNTLAGGAFGFTQTALDRQQVGAWAGGALVPSRIFLFGDVQHTRFSDTRPPRNSGTDASVRYDQNLADGMGLTVRYGISDGIFFERRGQLFGSALRADIGPGVNDVRFSLGDHQTAAVPGVLEPRSYGIADTFSWASGSHAVRTGVQWRHTEVSIVPGGTTDRLSVFLQDDWRLGTSLSVQGGVRVDRLHPPDALGDPATHVLPRVSAAWQLARETATVFRAGYGRFAEDSGLFPDLPAVDQWTLGVARQWGRTRTVEVAYEGSRVPDLGTFNFVVAEIEQRSQVGLTGHLAYRFGTSDLDDVVIEDAADPSHKLTGAFTWWLPFGDERLLFSDGLLEDIFGEMQLTGVFAVDSVRTDPQTDRRGDFKTLDLGVLKNIRVAERTLQLRFEMFNTLNRPNRRPFFYPDLLSVPAAGNEGRRYQIGVRYLY